MNFPEERKSKSQVKRDMIALQELGVALTKLKLNQLNNIPLPEKLREAVIQTSQLKKGGGLRRHLQYIGKLMRTADAVAIQSCLDKMYPPKHKGN